MAEIKQLSPHVADLIAAGEVVERPASVVKELTENAIDAGATQILVEIQRGGLQMIRVADNGSGIAPRELPTAFLRHATSKLRSAADLAAIGTLGFRGEALAAISAVSRLTVLSRERGSSEGASLTLIGGKPEELMPAGCPEGTTMVVRDLFFNTPARLKFMKKDSAEGAAVNALLQQLALSNPQISFRLLRDGAEILHTPGDNQLKSAIYAVLGREFALEMVEVKGQSEGITVTGYATKPQNGRGSRGLQIFFVNGRLVKSPLLTTALEEAYQNQLLKGKFPGCVLHITLPKEEVDVNVHPAKTVVKFEKEQAVFSTVRHTVEDSLERALRPVSVPTETKPSSASLVSPPNKQGISVENLIGKAKTATIKPKEDFYRQMDAKTYVETVSPKKLTFSDHSPNELLRKFSTTAGQTVENSPTEKPLTATASPQQAKPTPTKPFPSVAAPQPPIKTTSIKETTPPVIVPQPEPEAETAPPPPPQLSFVEEDSETPPPAPWRFVGEVLKTYILAEDGDTVWLIDKHAAHERLNFDRLKQRQEPIVSQALLTSIPLRVSPEESATLLLHREFLLDFGFEIEDFGNDTILVRGVPAEVDTSLVEETLLELAQKLQITGTADPTAARDALYHTMACKAAIKGGWNSDISELTHLIKKVQSGEVRFCPHGRPVAVKLTKYEIEKMFLRA